jgi:hypothetical protein
MQRQGNSELEESEQPQDVPQCLTP